jgi:hypothetical protein
MAAPRSDIDWEAIEKDYRAGIATLRQIAETHGTTHTSVSVRARRDGWDRDLGAKIRAKAESLVSKAEVSSEISKTGLASEKHIVESNAAVVAAVAIGHRSSIKRNRSLSEKLLDELEAQCDDPEAFEKLGELMASPDEKGADKLNDLYRKVIGLPSRIDSAKKLAETVRILVTMEREAYGMDKDQQNTDNPLHALLQAIGGSVIGPRNAV